MPPSTERLEHIAGLYAAHAGQLRDVVTKRGSRNSQIVQDACAHAWAQLVAAEHVSLQPPRWRALSWLTTTAIREAWRLERDSRRVCATGSTAMDTLRPREDAGVDELVLARLRLDLVRQLPERPRRFLLRLALGYSYREIAEAEHASYTTTSKQIARAKRLLRELEARGEAGGEKRVPGP